MTINLGITPKPTRATIIFLFICIISNTTYGQAGYYSTDSLTSLGIDLIDNGDLLNSKFCTVKMDDNTVQYSPGEV